MIPSRAMPKSGVSSEFHSSRRHELVASGASGSVHLGTKIKYSEEIVHEARDTDPARASVTGKTRYIVELDGRTRDCRKVFCPSPVRGQREETSDFSIKEGKDLPTRVRGGLLDCNGKLIREKTWETRLSRGIITPR